MRIIKSHIVISELKIHHVSSIIYNYFLIIVMKTVRNF